jgi:hypothetical protein
VAPYSICLSVYLYDSKNKALLVYYVLYILYMLYILCILYTIYAVLKLYILSVNLYDSKHHALLEGALEGQQLQHHRVRLYVSGFNRYISIDMMGLNKV